MPQLFYNNKGVKNTEIEYKKRLSSEPIPGLAACYLKFGRTSYKIPIISD